MSIKNEKLWLLQHERALLAIIRHPDRTLHSIAKTHAVNFDDLSEFLEKFCPDGAELNEARLRQIKIELGVIAEGKIADQARKTAPAVPEKPSPTVPPPPPVIPPPIVAPKPARAIPAAKESSDFPRPWLKPRRWRRSAFVRWKSALIKLRENPELKLARIVTVDAGYGRFARFVRRWFGEGRPSQAQIDGFLAFADSRHSGEKPSVPGTGEMPTPSAPIKSKSPADQGEFVTVGAKGATFRIEITVRILPA